MFAISIGAGLQRLYSGGVTRSKTLRWVNEKARPPFFYSGPLSQIRQAVGLIFSCGQ